MVPFTDIIQSFNHPGILIEVVRLECKNGILGTLKTSVRCFLADVVNLTDSCVKTVVIMTVAAVCRVQDALDEEILHLSGTYPE